MDDIQASFGRITGIYTRHISINEPFENFASRFADMPGTVVLLSGGDLDCSRYHILATKPWLTLSGDRLTTDLTFDDVQISLDVDPFSALKKILAIYRFKDERLSGLNLPDPIASGLFGYLAYDLKDGIEDLPRTTINDTHLPLMLLYAPAILVVHDKITGQTRLAVTKRKLRGMGTLEKDLAFFNRKWASPSNATGTVSGLATGLKSNFSKADYVRAVENIIEYIASGHVYQVNMSQRFTADFSGHPYSLFTTYYRMNPAPFFAYVNAGDHHIVSTSPERFIFRKKSLVETRPIKGTRPRGKTTEEDENLKKELFNSKKDDAELSMIVDLLRNDIGKVCAGESVFVDEHKRVEAYENVYHLVSVVKGRLASHFDSADLIRAAFPGGSITGCPKIRSMEIIDEMETHRRHIYTGAIGYISFHDTMDLSIAIRTATVCNGKIIFSVGGGIVFDSAPELEFEETLHKGRTLMSVFRKKEISGQKPQTVWINGKWTSIDKASVPITDLGFQYGYGFFETIRAVNGKAKNLAAHLRRFNTSWNQLFHETPPDLSWEEIIGGVLIQNGLEKTAAAIKFMATRGSRDLPPYDHCLIVTARPYVHRLSGKKEQGLNLVRYPHPRQSPLASHKSLNYLYYFLAGKWAANQGADEGLITNPDGTLSETNTANLILVTGKTAVLPESPHVLPGTMENRVAGILRDRGYNIQRMTVDYNDLFSYDDVLLTNALMGAVPALRVDGKKLKSSSEIWKEINEEVL